MIGVALLFNSNNTPVNPGNSAYVPISVKSWTDNILIYNPGFETWTSQTALTNWTYSNIQRSTDADSGTYSTQLSLNNTELYNSTVQAGLDDAETCGPFWYNALTYTEFGYDTSWFYAAFMRWSLDIPKGSEIKSAYITVRALTAYPNDFSFNTSISYLDVDNCPDFTYNSTSNATAGGVIWTVPLTWTTGQLYNTSDITSLVQAFVNRAGYTSGNYIGIRITGANPPQVRRFNTYEAGAGNIERLVINYTAVEMKGYVSQNLTENTPVSGIKSFSFEYKHNSSSNPTANGVKCMITYTDASSSNTGWLTPTSNWQTEDLVPHLTAGKIVDSVKIEQEYDCGATYKPVLVDIVKIYAVNWTHSGDVSDGVLDSIDVSGQIVNQIDGTTSFNLSLFENDVYKDSKSINNVFSETFTYTHIQAAYGFRINDSTTGVTTWLNYTVQKVEIKNSSWTLGGLPVSVFYTDQAYELNVFLKWNGGSDAISGTFYENNTPSYALTYASITMPSTPQTLYVMITPINTTSTTYDYGIRGDNLTVDVTVESPPLVLHSFNFWNSFYPLYSYVVMNVSYWINSTDIANASYDMKFYETGGMWFNVSSVTAFNTTNSSSTGIFSKYPWTGTEKIYVFAYQGSSLIGSIGPENIPFESYVNVTGLSVDFPATNITIYNALTFTVNFNASNLVSHLAYIRATVYNPILPTIQIGTVETDPGTNSYNITFGFTPLTTWAVGSYLNVAILAENLITVITEQNETNLHIDFEPLSLAVNVTIDKTAADTLTPFILTFNCNFSSPDLQPKIAWLNVTCGTQTVNIPTYMYHGLNNFTVMIPPQGLYANKTKNATWIVSIPSVGLNESGNFTVSVSNSWVENLLDYVGPSFWTQSYWNSESTKQVIYLSIGSMIIIVLFVRWITKKYNAKGKKRHRRR